MKTIAKLLFVAFTACLLTACSEKPVSPDTPYVIEGEVTGINDGLEIRLIEFDGLVGSQIAVDTVSNGKFRFEQVMHEPELNWLAILVTSDETPGNACAIYVEPGAHIKVIGHDNHVYTWDVVSKVPEQQANKELIEAAKAEWEEYQSLAIASHKALNEYREIDREKEPERRKEAYNLYKRINDQMDSMYVKIQGKEIEQMKKMKPSKPWMRELETMSEMAGAYEDYANRENVIELYNSLPEEIKHSEKGQEIYAKLYPPKKVKDGEDCPDADFYDLQGNLHHISEFKGKYILLDFWSSGCGPCIQAFPEMKELYEQYADQLAIISMSTDTDRRWHQASEKHDITWNNWNEGKGSAGFFANFPNSAIPFYVLVNPDGKVEKQMVGYKEGMFKTLFSELLE